MAWERLSELNDGQHLLWAYCRGKDGGPPCDHSARLDLPALIARYGDIGVDGLRDRLRCQCGARARVVMSHTGRSG